MILDTTFLVDILRGDRAATEMAARLEREPDVPRVPTPAVFELFEGIERSRNPPKEMLALREVLQGDTVIPVSLAHAMGDLVGQPRRRGIVGDDREMLIAGMALVERDAVLTLNGMDFARIAELRVETY